jgi:hypothetical protein
MRKLITGCVFVAFMVLICGVVAEDKIPLDVTIKSVKGDVEIKAPGGAWEKASSGSKLREGTLLSTGFGAEAELILADNSAVTVYQLTQLKIDKFFREKAKVKTDLDLNIGKVRAEVQRVGDQLSDFNVVTPTSVVSVRGTGMDVFQTDRGTDARGLVHTIEVRDNLGRRELVGPNQQTMVCPGEVPTPVVAECQNRAKVDTSVLGLTKGEIRGRQAIDIPEMAPGNPGKAGSIS